MWRRSDQAHWTASMATIAVIATAAMFLLSSSNSNSCEAAAVLVSNSGGGGNVTYGGVEFSMEREEAEREMLMEELYFGVHVARVMAQTIRPSTATGKTGKAGKQACPKDKYGKYHCSPKANGKNKGGCKSAYCKS